MTKPFETSTSRRGFIAGSLAGAGTLLIPRGATAEGQKGKVLFRDRFKRESETGWGAPWFNQRYQHVWTVRNGFGRYDLPPPIRGKRFPPNPVLVLDKDVTNVDLQAVLATTDPSVRIGLVARAVGYFNSLVAFLEGEALVLGRCGWHGIHTLARKENALNPSLMFNMRFMVRGTRPQRVWAKIWGSGYPEPRDWQVSAQSWAPALAAPGAFGFITQHSNERMTTSAALTNFVARSDDTPVYTAPSVAYSLTGVAYEAGSKAGLVAKSNVPASIGFEYGTDPAFGEGTKVVAEAPVAPDAQVVRGDIDLSPFGSNATVHWRPFVTRNGAKVYGEANRFSTPPSASDPVKFAFGSCALWEPETRTSFESARAQSPAFFLHEGDFGYVRGAAAVRQADSFQDVWTRMFEDPSLKAMTREVPVSFQRDDAEYGQDRANRDTLQPFTIEAHGNMVANPANDPYWFSYGSVSVFCLDCRRFSTGDTAPEPERTRLGEAQRTWLGDSMHEAASAGASLLVVAAPMAFGGPAHPEAWFRYYRNEWDSLMGLFAGIGTPVLILSGNSHLHTVVEHPGGSAGAQVVEFISSGTEQRGWPVMTDQNVAKKFIKANAFGTVEVGAPQLEGAQTSRTVRLSCLKSADGSPWFQSEYLAVDGVGLVPVPSH